MKKSLHIKCGTFLVKQGFIYASLLFLCCIGIPGMFFIGDSDQIGPFINDVFSSVETSCYFIVMISAPIIAFLVVILGNIDNYFSSKKNPKVIKAISLSDECIILHYKKSIYDKSLYFDEIKEVYFLYKTHFINPDLFYELDICITDKYSKQYTMTIPARFSNNPYKEMQKVEEFFERINVKVISDK